MEIPCCKNHLKKMLFFSFLLFLNVNSISASMRVDIPERTKEQVVENSIRLGENLPVAKITGSVQIEGIEGGTIGRYWRGYRSHHNFDVCTP
jgi:hypothetical protein